jgi:tRNA modification GTPase
MLPPEARTDDTIVALSTPPGQGALAVVRLSGPDALRVAAACWRGGDLAQAAGHSAHYGRVIAPQTGLVLDEVVLTLYRAPRSYTREDVVEISLHGSPYIVQTVISALMGQGARPAQPGEFTLRAFLNGALDLAQAEAVADLIAAESAAAHRLAFDQLRGKLRTRLAELRTALVDLAALLELELDFGEEEVEFADRSQLLARLAETRAEVERLRDSFVGGQAIRQGIPTVILGRPNAGKSTLLNRLLGEDRAIVSATPGTTRDVLQERFQHAGYEFRLIDTAGLRHETHDDIEREGIRRTEAELMKARLALYVFDASQTPEGFATSLEAAQAHVATLALPQGCEFVYLANKADLINEIQGIVNQTDKGLFSVIPISAATGLGLEALLDWLRVQAERLLPDDAVLTHARHADACQRAAEALLAAQAGLKSGLGTELIALDLRTALHALGEITGQVTPDDVLGSIFSKFCIGK